MLGTSPLSAQPMSSVDFLVAGPAVVATFTLPATPVVQVVRVTLPVYQKLAASVGVIQVRNF